MTRFEATTIDRDAAFWPAAWRPAIADFTDLCAERALAPSLRRLLFCLRDMSYRRPEGGGNETSASLDQWRGTCSTKHLLAFELLSLFGYAPRLWMASCRVSGEQALFPDAIKRLLRENEVYDVHNFLTCDLGAGEITVDLTFPPRHRDKGLPVTLHWTPDVDFVLACDAIERRAIPDPGRLRALKTAWLEELNTPEGFELREQVIACYAGLDQSPQDRRTQLRAALAMENP